MDVLDVPAGPPLAVPAPVPGEARWSPGTGGRPQYAQLWLEIDQPPAAGISALEWAASDADIPPAARQPIAAALHAALLAGDELGAPWPAMTIRLTGGRHHPLDSTPLAWGVAARLALRAALRAAGLDTNHH